MSTAKSHRVVALDGALLAFDPNSGTRWLLRSSATRALRASAPPLVLFSITNACNLACHFCYRDTRIESAWTVESAYQLLATLARRGTLEVAFGGGEPFAFAGFSQLIERLSDTTALALHATTNGALLTRRKLDAVRGRIRELRLSVYDDTDWAEKAAMIAGSGISLGLHWLVTPQRLRRVRAMVDQALALGAKKLFLLSYNGHDRAMHLSHEASRELSRTIESLRDLPIELGLSACWGDRMEALPKLSPDRGEDCGAGSHFISIGPDGALSPCSFHHQRRAVKNAEEALEAWSAMRACGPAQMPGCRRLPMSPTLPDGLWRWTSWSGNNSTDCFVIGRFASATAADDAINELRSLTEARDRSLIDQAWEALDSAREALRRQTKNPKEFAQAYLAEQEGNEAWLREVRSWEQGPTKMQRYARALGAVDRDRTLPTALEVPDQMLSFGTLGMYLQGTTLQPFRALEWLWGYRGGGVFNFARSDSRSVSVVWAAKAKSEGEARRHAIELGVYSRGNSLWGVTNARGYERVASRWVQGRGLEFLRLELEDRGLRFDGVAITEDADAEALARAVSALRPAPPAVAARISFVANDEVSDEVVRGLRALDADPSTLFEWTQQRIDGSRRWPRDFAIHRFGYLHLLEAERLPPSLTRGLLLRNTSTPYTIEAREVRVTVAVFNDRPERARAQLRSLGLTLADAPEDARGWIVTTKPAVVLARVCSLSDRREVSWNTALTPADALVNAAEVLQSRLDLRLAKGDA